MSLYRHILCAVDLTEDAGLVVDRASLIAERNSAKLTLIHVIEPLTMAYGSDVPLDLTSLQEEITHQAKEHIKALSEKLKCLKSDQHVVYGRPEREVHRIANENNADLIVVGSRGKQGFSLILGSTSTSILHGAKCDVLAVRVGLGDS